MPAHTSVRVACVRSVPRATLSTQLRDTDELSGAARNLPEAYQHEEDGAEQFEEADEDGVGQGQCCRVLPPGVPFPFYPLEGVILMFVICFVTTLALGGECKGSAFGYVCQFVCLSVFARYSKDIAPINLNFFMRGDVVCWSVFCLSVRVCNSKTIAPINLLFYTRRCIQVALSSSKMIRIWTPEFIKGLCPAIARCYQI